MYRTNNNRKESEREKYKDTRGGRQKEISYTIVKETKVIGKRERETIAAIERKYLRRLNPNVIHKTNKKKHFLSLGRDTMLTSHPARETTGLK